MRHEKIFKREDGSRVKITVFFGERGFARLSWHIEVSSCKPNKRKWIPSYNENCWNFRQMSPEQKVIHIVESQRNLVSEEEIVETKTELWMKLKPDLYDTEY